MWKKRMGLIGLLFILLIPTIYGTAETPDEVKAETKEGKYSSKDEVVYGKLTANGTLDEIFVVNTFEVETAGEMIDYGKYEKVKNLTDVSKIEQNGEEITFRAPEGKFYYQGNLRDKVELPWNFHIMYELDGKKISLSELAGKSGHVKITIQTEGNGENVFYENYLLQISLEMSNEYEHIDAPDGMVANVGKNKQITFTVLPKEEKELTVEADVKDFEFDGVQIAAVPSSFPIDTEDIHSMTEDMGALSDGIEQLNDGVAQLNEGVSKLNDGADLLKNGSSQYKEGINQLDRSSDQILQGSSSIHDALKNIHTSVSGSSGELDITSLSQLPEGLFQLANALTEIEKNLQSFQGNYRLAYQNLEKAINEIPSEPITDEETYMLLNSGLDGKLVEKLMGYYASSQKVKGTFHAVKEAFQGVEKVLAGTSDGVKEISGALNEIGEEISSSIENMNTDGLEELQKGLKTLASKYGEFHEGLKKYTNGVGELTTSYDQIHAGIDQLATGTEELQSGARELHKGTNKLHEETNDLPTKMREEIDKMVKEFDKSDFKPVSFVSEKNKNVSSVQFVIKSASIQKEEKKETKVVEEEEKGFFDLLLDLFRKD